MSIYNLCVGVTTSQTIASVSQRFGAEFGTNPIAKPWGADSNTNVPPQNQAFEATVNANSANPSAVVQPVMSNDGINWTNYGSAMTVQAIGGASFASAMVVGNTPGAYFGAFVSAISGTNAKVNCTMSA